MRLIRGGGINPLSNSGFFGNEFAIGECETASEREACPLRPAGGVSFYPQQTAWQSKCPDGQVVKIASGRRLSNGFVTLSAFSCGECSGQQASCGGGCPGPSAE